MTRVLVCGGRDFANRDLLFRRMDELDARFGPFTVVIHGAASGADSLAQAWAFARDRRQKPFPADWSKGRKAGPMRNAKMLMERPELVVGFPGGSGTADMLTKARAAGIKVVDVPDPEGWTGANS